ncbi:MAG: DUF1223 domain-containing protein [Pseudomonadota bacterium]
MDSPIVVELFTSQSCSSCPPADKNLAALSEDPKVIALGFHVTYWNHLHWEDTLSQQFATDRQRAYSRYKRSSRFYTPQMIVNGNEEFVGSRKSAIQNALKNAKPIQTIRLSKNGGMLKAELPKLETDRYTLWLIGTKNSHTQEIPSGENRGRTVTYKNAVTQYKNLQSWDGEPQDIEINISDESVPDHYVLIAQKAGHGPIMAAGKTE